MTSDLAPVEPLSVTRFREEPACRGGTGRVVVLPDTVHTAALAAAALGWVRRARSRTAYSSTPTAGPC